MTKEGIIFDDEPQFTEDEKEEWRRHDNQQRWKEWNQEQNERPY